MESVKEALFSQNVIVWAILIVLVFLFLKFLQSLGKSFVILIGILGVVFVLYRFFPSAVAPMVDFMNGGWMGDNR